MEASIRGNGLTITDDLRQHIDRRLSRFDRWVSRIIDAKVELRTSVKRSGRRTVTAQITLQTPRNILRAEAEDGDATAAIDRAADKLAIQLRRYHERRTTRAGDRDPVGLDVPPAGLLSELAAGDAADDAGEDGSADGNVVRVKRFGLKPMDVDEAIAQMELLGHDFFLFDNSEEGTISVVYRRRAGDYGVLVPERR